MKKQMAFLVYRQIDELDEYGSYVSSKKVLVRYTNPVVDGKFTGGGWFAPPYEVEEDVQTLANERGEIIWDDIHQKYIVPQNREERRV